MSEEEMNCFYCDGHDKLCDCYVYAKKYDMCYYRSIADRDLLKHRTGIGCVTLEAMLDIYLRTEQKDEVD